MAQGPLTEAAGPSRAGLVPAACSAGMAVMLAVLAGVGVAVAPAGPTRGPAWLALTLALLGLPLTAVGVALQFAAYARAVAVPAVREGAAEPGAAADRAGGER